MEVGQFELETLCNRGGSFEPQLVQKGQTRFTSINDKGFKPLCQGMTTPEIVATFKDMYGADVLPSLISCVTDAVIKRVVEWQSCPLDPVYLIVYLDYIVLKIRQDKQVINKSVYLALGVTMEGHKELLGMWMSENEGTKFWLTVLTELQNRGLQDILIACVDGLKGFPNAINSAYPNTLIQLCIVHMVRNSVRYVPWKDYKAVTADLSAPEDKTLLELEQFSERWDAKYPQISRSWRSHWQNLNTLFSYPPNIRKAIHITNAIESLNSVIRKVIKKRKLFPTDDSAKKVVFLAIMEASKNGQCLSDIGRQH